MCERDGETEIATTFIGQADKSSAASIDTFEIGDKHTIILS